MSACSDVVFLNTGLIYWHSFCSTFVPRPAHQSYWKNVWKKEQQLLFICVYVCVLPCKLILLLFSVHFSNATRGDLWALPTDVKWIECWNHWSSNLVGDCGVFTFDLFHRGNAGWIMPTFGCVTAILRNWHCWWIQNHSCWCVSWKLTVILLMMHYFLASLQIVTPQILFHL